jgi:hypothetical protein
VKGCPFFGYPQQFLQYIHTYPSHFGVIFPIPQSEDAPCPDDRNQTLYCSKLVLMLAHGGAEIREITIPRHKQQNFVNNKEYSVSNAHPSPTVRQGCKISREASTSS